MGSEFALVLLIGSLFAGGAGIGLAVGFKPGSWIGWGGFSGIAYLLGFSGFAIGAQLVAVLGLPIWLALVVPVLAMLLIPRHLPERPKPLQFRAADRIASFVYAVLVILLLLVGSWIAIRNPVTAWDSWSIWTRKAVMLGDSIDQLTLPGYEFIHPDYPIGLPSLQAVFFALAGSDDTVVGDLPGWLLVPAGLAGLAAIAPGQPRYFLPVLGALAVVPPVAAQTLAGYADVPSALFVCTAVLAGSRWLVSREDRHIWLTGMMIAGAICIKNETMIVGLLVLLLLTFFGRGSLRSIVPAWGLAMAAFLPWRIWLAGNGIEGDVPLSRLSDPAYLIDNIDRPWQAFGTLLSESLFKMESVERVLFAAVLIAALVLLLLGLGQVAGRFGFLATAGAVVALLTAYWVSPSDLDWYLLNSADRVVFLPVSILLTACLPVIGGKVGEGSADQGRTTPPLAPKWRFPGRTRQ